MLLNLMNWWQALSGTEQIFWSIGLISNAFFVVYLLLHFFGGHDTDFADHGDLDVDAGFTILSIRSLLAFAMFLGWTGVVALRLGFNLPVAIAAGVVAGIAAMWLVWRLLRILLRLQDSGTLDLKNALGQTGTVHLLIPAAGQGSGKVMITVQGALRELEALSDEMAIPTGESVLVVGVTDDGLLIVQPFHV